MNKQEFLSKLSEEELHLLRNIMSCEITKELNKRNSKTPIEVGDCFIYRNDYDDIYLTKVMSGDPDCPNWDGKYFDCEEISIDNHDIDVYEISYHIDDFDEHDRIDPEIFNTIAALINDRDNALDKICKEFDKQIRELCLTSLNTQNKNLKIEELCH